MIKTMTKIVKMSADSTPTESNSHENSIPSNSNHSNTASSTSDELSEAACKALDIVTSKQEQTYDNFLKSFTHLHKDDITEQLIKTQEKLFKDNVKVKAEEEATDIIAEDDVEVEDIDSDEIIETLNEVAPGAPSTSGIMQRPETPGSIVKLDNFVQDEGNKEDDLEIDIDDDEAPYLPDFSDTNMTPRGGTTVLSPRIQALSASPPQCDPLIYDSTGVPVTPEETHNDLSGDKEDDLEIKIPDIVTNFPGEIEAVQISPRASDIQHLRQLDFSTQEYKADPSNPPMLDPIESDNFQACDVENQVEAFSLDTDFDYDNVVLTPKYTAEEMAIIAQGFANRNNTTNSDL